MTWSRRLASIAILAVLLAGIPFAVVVWREYRAGADLSPGGRVLRFAGEDWGAPSPFRFYPRGPGYIHMSLVFDTLTWKDARGVVGLLAQSWHRSADEKQYTFTLRPGIRWHDGSRLTARDVAFSIDYLKKHHFTWTDLSPIRSARALDDLQVVVDLHTAHAPFLTDIAGSFPVLPAHIWEKVDDPRQFMGQDSLTGSGPFRLESYSSTHGTYSYAANPHYFLGRPRIDRIQYIAAGDSLLALRKGEIDAIPLWSRTLDAVAEFRSDPRYRIVEGPGDWVLRLVFNHRHPALARREIRSAFAHVLDLDDIAERLRHGFVEPGSPAFLPPASTWRHPHLQAYTHDVARARELVEASGVGDLHLVLLTTPDYVREAEVIAEQAREIGIEISVHSVPASTRDAMLRDGRFDLAIDGHGGIGGDPDVLRRQFCPSPDSEAAHSVLNPASAYGYTNADLCRLGDAQLHEVDAQRRREIVLEMQAILARDLPTIALWYPRVFFVYNPDVLDGWFYAPGGIAGGIPLAENKLVYIRGGPLK
ncbi:MAG: hypothetical protein JXR96_21450 [Deltaproteobacteria bacterium]|nr:hypothetical protein [Deltaproteobacteria bacterium]